jgi:6-phosphogluconate dehydrogenase
MYPVKRGFIHFLSILQVMKHRVIIITGVSGSGKTSVGEALSKLTHLPFFDGDDFHPQLNKEKMAAGIPLDDTDRRPWLAAMNAFIKEHLERGSLIIACSALKENYRQWLTEDLDVGAVAWFHLQGSYELIYQRMVARKGHYMGAGMLQSQFRDYEYPQEGRVISVDATVEEIAMRILKVLGDNQASIGLIGLGVMGTSLARNIARSHFPLAIYNRRVEGKEEGVAERVRAQYQELGHAFTFEDMQAFVAALAPPRQIIMMVNAGKAVDAVIEELLPGLQAGDVLIDGGNSHYSDTVRREQMLKLKGVYFVGAGISGGEEGALHGPAIMPGGSREGYGIVKEVLDAIAARNADGEICCQYIGEEGSGHFVKMVHNGIEYAEMALIAEVYSYLRYGAGMPVADIAGLFESWNKGDTASYLLEITIDILRYKDEDGGLLLDKILDQAGNKGTGSWTSVAAAELGVATPSLTAALYARYLSAQHAQRQEYASVYDVAYETAEPDLTALQMAYQLCRLMHHHQGFSLIRAASDAHGWKVDMASLLTIWSGGCIIRSVLLGLLKEGWEEAGGDVLMHAYTRSLAAGYYTQIQQSALLVGGSVAASPVMMAGLQYFKQCTEARSNAYMIQAQRDYFGAHSFVLSNDPLKKSRHVDWKGRR